MTALHVIWAASIAGALLFFAAGAATMLLRRAPARIDATRELLADTTAREALLERDTAHAARARAEAAVRDAMHERDTAHALARDAVIERDNAVAGAQAVARDALAERDRALSALQSTEVRVRELTVERDKAATAAKTAEARVREAMKGSDSAGATIESFRRELDAALAMTRDLEHQLATRNDTVRDLATENEHLKGRLRDADALRAEYVRLRTATTESEYLKTEITRLEKELAETRAAALNAPALKARPRPRRTTDRSPTKPPPAGTIAESLAVALERFAEDGTHSIAVGDPQGFVLASCGDDGTALAAHAAQLAEAAQRAKSLLPIGAPTSIEVADERGVRLCVWTFAVDGEPLLLAEIGTHAPEAKRVEKALADVAALLAPTSPARAASY